MTLKSSKERASLTTRIRELLREGHTKEDAAEMALKQVGKVAIKKKENK